LQRQATDVSVSSVISAVKLLEQLPRTTLVFTTEDTAIRERKNQISGMRTCMPT
jgi:hypothetical protein